MGRIIISTNTTLDGIIQDPDGEEGFPRGNWFFPVGSPDREAWAAIEAAEADDASALLFGRRSYAWFASRWETRGGEWADRLRALPKFVQSATLTNEEATWGATTILRGDVVEEVSNLKNENAGDIVIYASYQLGQTLLQHDLVDEVRIFLAPVVLGSGRRLFGETSVEKPLRLVRVETVGKGTPFLIYEVERS